MAEVYEVNEPFFCPVTVLEKLKKHQKSSGTWAENRPVFRRASGKNLSKSKFLETVNRALNAVGHKEIRVVGKSFRSGILSALEKLPLDFQEAHLKMLGRWKGDSYKFYMWKGPIQFSQTFKSVSETLLKDFNYCRFPETQVGASQSPQQRQRRR